MRPEGGLGFVRRMLDLGILNEKSSLVHFVWANDDDISAALDAGITVVHSPLSNAMLGAGVAPISKNSTSGYSGCLWHRWHKLRPAGTIRKHETWLLFDAPNRGRF